MINDVTNSFRCFAESSERLGKGRETPTNIRLSHSKSKILCSKNDFIKQEEVLSFGFKGLIHLILQHLPFFCINLISNLYFQSSDRKLKNPFLNQQYVSNQLHIMEKCPIPVSFCSFSRSCLAQKYRPYKYCSKRTWFLMQMYQ